MTSFPIVLEHKTVGAETKHSTHGRETSVGTAGIVVIAGTSGLTRVIVRRQKLVGQLVTGALVTADQVATRALALASSAV